MRIRVADYLSRKGAYCWVKSLRTQHRPDRPWLRRMDRALRWLADRLNPERVRVRQVQERYEP